MNRWAVTAFSADDSRRVFAKRGFAPGLPRARECIVGATVEVLGHQHGSSGPTFLSISVDDKATATVIDGSDLRDVTRGALHDRIDRWWMALDSE